MKIHVYRFSSSFWFFIVVPDSLDDVDGPWLWIACWIYFCLPWHAILLNFDIMKDFHQMNLESERRQSICVYIVTKHIWSEGKSTTYSHSTSTCGFLLPFTSYICWGDLLSSYLVLHEGNRLNCFIHVLLTTLLRLIWLSKWASYMSYVSVSKKVVHIENRTHNTVLLKRKKIIPPFKEKQKICSSFVCHYSRNKTTNSMLCCVGFQKD